jgi:hypothetical protein
MTKMTNDLFTILINRLPAHVVQALKDTDQSPKWHAEGNVLIHTEMVFNEVVKAGSDPDLLVAAIFHDLGKIDTHKEEILPDGTKKISHHGHEHVSLKYIDKYIHLFSDFITDEEIVRDCVHQHMRAHKFLDGSMKKPTKRKAFEEMKHYEKVILFSKCDEKGRIHNKDA